MKPVSLSITGLQHVGIPVTNIKASETFYQNLGFTKVMESPFDYKGNTGTCIMMKRESIMMELYQFPANELQGIRSRGDGHIDHIAFDVPDIDEAFAALKNAGYSMLEEMPTFLKFWTNGVKFFNILGPDGERLEFNQIL
jgi:catechol 2,3-dioxygenase-like lactoylglutathione lyase family enzyme